MWWLVFLIGGRSRVSKFGYAWRAQLGAAADSHLRDLLVLVKVIFSSLG